MTIKAADIRELPSGEFSALEDHAITPWIERAKRRIGAVAWGDLADDATLYLAAHLLASVIKGAAGPAGPITGTTAGPTSVTFGNPTASGVDPNLQATSYGREYLSLLEGLGLGPMVV